MSVSLCAPCSQEGATMLLPERDSGSRVCRAKPNLRLAESYIPALILALKCMAYSFIAPIVLLLHWRIAVMSVAVFSFILYVDHIYLTLPNSVFIDTSRSTLRTGSTGSSQEPLVAPSPASSCRTCTGPRQTKRSSGVSFPLMRAWPAGCPTRQRPARSPSCKRSSARTPPATVWESRWSTTS